MRYVNPFRATLVALICILAFIFAAPNLFSDQKVENFPSILPSQKINQGLDLRGGSYLLLQVELKTLSSDMLKNARIDVRTALREAEILHRSTIAGDKLQISLVDESQLGEALKVIKKIYKNWNITASGSLIDMAVNPEDVASRASEAVGQSIEVIRRRVDPQGVKEPIIQRQGHDRIVLQVPGEENPEKLKEVLGKTARLEFYLGHPIDTKARSSFPIAPEPGYQVFPGEDENKDGTPDIYYQTEERLIMSGMNLKSANAVADPNSRGGGYSISFILDVPGGTAFANATTSKNRGRPIVIVLDGEVISAPAVNDHITGGSGLITGDFTLEEASDLSNLLNAGALPVPLKVVEEQTVGPSLGKDAIEAGEKAAVIGLVLVIVFMIFMYLRFGVFATIALFFNILIIIALLSLLQATLTLPGIAGIVLTIGMAVDANVIIFERIREESQKLKPYEAVQTGYSNAMSTILDANITTLIASAILYQFGTGPIKGFAVTLAFGVLASLFTAIYLTKLLINIWLSVKNPKQMQVGQAILNKVPALPFMNLRKIAPMISLGLIVLSFILLPIKGLNLGLDFTGGSQLIVSAPNAQVEDIRKATAKSGISGIGVTSYGHEGQYMISIPTQQGEDGIQDAAVKSVRSQLPENVTVEGTSTIGGSVSEELKTAGIIAVSLSILAMLVYISFRFEWQFGLAAVIALSHDVVLTLGFFSLLGLDFSLTTVAAILTIAGYSINDTVVVFDRVRENMQRYKRMPMIELLNMTLNQTLSRTIMTSLTTLLALIALFVFGTSILKNFSAAMIWGVLIGTWSSLFIAVPMLLVLKVKQKTDEQKKAEASPYGNL